jgi:prepilin-type N-terminal cleavage/methylation domain-containing protein
MSNNKGFTLIELIVAMAIFLFVVAGAIGIFISIILHQKRVLAEQQLINQVSYVEEYMSKALRMATYDGNGRCLNENKGVYLLTHPNSSGVFMGIKFLNQSDENSLGEAVCQEFYLNGSGTAEDPYVLMEKKDSAEPVAITSQNLQLDSVNPIRFAINGLDGSSINCDNLNGCGALDTVGPVENPVQPKVTILLNVKMPGDNQEPARTIQTTVSQRNLYAK